MRRTLPALLLFTTASTLAGQAPTWSDDVACIVYTHCTPCHHEGGAGHFSLTTYADAYYWRIDMRDLTQVRYMPPWPPDEAYRSLAHERSLTQDEIDIIAAWVNADSPEGLPQNAPPPPAYSNEPLISPADITAIMEDYVIPASTTDLYRCFVLDIDNPEDRYITGMEVIPGNTRMVHHALVYQDTSGQARVLDDGDLEPGYTSFGGIGVEGAKLIGVWVPGADPFFTPPGMGIKLLADADIVIQIHYPANSEVEVDSTRLNIQLSPGGFVRDLAIDPILYHGPPSLVDGPLIIPPNEVRTFHEEYTVTFPATITAIGPHSHLLGKRMKAYAVRPGNDTVPLIDIPDWDFRWQGLYSFRQPIYLPTGTVVYGEATYDNTVDNPDNPNTPPDWVWLGEATTNEMMLFYFAWTIGLQSDENIVVDNSAHQAHYLACTTEFNIGMGEVAASSQLGVRPVPAHNAITVTTDGQGSEVRLLDIFGRIVLSEQISDRTQEVDVAKLARGTYVVELLPHNGSNPLRTKVLLE
ncbi:MAG: T9SS type A sorting domain-containing protein [Flavobacteriales bacterium]